MSSEKTIVTVGSFDGVHLGHQFLLQRMADLAQQHSLKSVAITFWPHPRKMLDNEQDINFYLNTHPERMKLLKQCGVDEVVALPFNESLAQMTAPKFIKDVVVKKFNAHYLIVGQDHQFGNGRGGNAQNLSKIAAKNNLLVDIVDLKTFDRKISSSEIREALLAGDLASANQMLGYPYIISGYVLEGNRLGRTIGFPTANINAPGYKLLPKDGVYRVKVKTEGDDAFEHTGMLFIGKRTVLKQEDSAAQVEVNIFDFDKEIYGQKIMVGLTHRIRDDIKFDSIEKLAQQLHIDKLKIKNQK